MIFAASYLAAGILIAIYALWQCRGELVRWDIGAAGAIIFVWPMVLMILLVCLLTDEKKHSKLNP